MERPASVVRELVDNALDAGATKVTILLKEGGKQLIRVVDNGIGMHPEDAIRCIERHATSKIRTEKDLYDIRTLGFRGEALPSIGSVSRLEIRTRPADLEAGTGVLVEAGALVENQRIGMALGTEINVRNLFFNVPVRRKFLRAGSTEMGHCMDVVLKAAMSRPDVAFHLSMDERTLIRVKAPVSHEERIKQLLGADGRQLWSVDATDGEIRVHGYISNPSTHRSSAKNSLFSHVNGRHIQEPLVRRAVSQGYRGCIPKGRYPVCVFYIELPAHQVDVNAHPAKTEVRFRDPLSVSRVIAQAIQTRLESENVRRIPVFEPPGVQERLSAHPMDIQPASFSAPADPIPTTSVVSEESSGNISSKPKGPSSLCVALGSPFAQFSQVQVLGQLATSHMVVAEGARLFIVNLSKALQWLTLHDMRAAQALGNTAHQHIAEPKPISVSVKGGDRLVAVQDLLEDLGLRFVRLSPTSILVHTVPGPVDTGHVETVVQAIATASKLGSQGEGLQVQLESIIAHASIGAVPNLSHYDMRTICASLDEVEYHEGWGAPQFLLEITERP